MDPNRKNSPAARMRDGYLRIAMTHLKNPSYQDAFSTMEVAVFTAGGLFANSLIFPCAVLRT
jgi:hypothetical protein